MTGGFLMQLVFTPGHQSAVTPFLSGAPPPKKYPGSAPPLVLSNGNGFVFSVELWPPPPPLPPLPPCDFPFTTLWYWELFLFILVVPLIKFPPTTSRPTSRTRTISNVNQRLQQTQNKIYPRELRYLWRLLKENYKIYWKKNIHETLMMVSLLYN